MKKALYLLSMAFFCCSAVFAQSNNAILFTENGEKFQVVLNGILQNATPETNVKMTGLVADAYKARIVFADTKLGYLDFNMYFNEMGSEVTWNIKQNNKGQYVTRYVSGIPIAQAPPTPATQTVVVYTTTAPAPAPVVSNGVTTTTTTQSQSTTVQGTSGDDVHINMGVNVDGAGGNISINASGMGLEQLQRRQRQQLILQQQPVQAEQWFTTHLLRQHNRYKWFMSQDTQVKSAVRYLWHLKLSMNSKRQFVQKTSRTQSLLLQSKFCVTIA
jgi:hypothetical protein